MDVIIYGASFIGNISKNKIVNKNEKNQSEFGWNGWKKQKLIKDSQTSHAFLFNGRPSPFPVINFTSCISSIVRDIKSSRLLFVWHFIR